MFKGQLRPLIEFKLFHVPFDNASLIKGRHHNRGRAAPFRPLLGTSDLRAQGIFLHGFTIGLHRLIRKTCLAVSYNKAGVPKILERP